MMNTESSEQAPAWGRRKFLLWFGGLWSLLAIVPIAKVLADYLAPRKETGAVRESLQVATVDDIPVGTTKVVRFNRDPVILIHSESGQFRAYSARCTHLGCIVQYHFGADAHFSCNCHGSQFDRNGVNIAGPAPRPLAPFRVNIRGSAIVVSRT